MSIFGTITTTTTTHHAADIAAVLEFGAEPTFHKLIIEYR